MKNCVKKSNVYIYLISIIFVFFAKNAFSDAVFTSGPDMKDARMGHFSRVLPNGKVVLFGGHGTDFTSLSTAEIWDTASKSFTKLNMNYPHDAGAIAKLHDGRYLLTGGSENSGVQPDTYYNYKRSEIFNPTDNSFTATTSSMNNARTACKATTLSNGKVLIVGAWYNQDAATYSEVFDTLNGSFISTQPLNTPRAYPMLLPTNDGKAVVFGGGYSYGGTSYEQVELFDPSDDSFSVLQNTLINGESGWFIYDDSAIQVRQLNDGRYLLLAYNSLGDYLLFTFDPETKIFAKFNTFNNLANWSTEWFFQPVVDNSKNVAYLLGVMSGADPTQIRIWTLNISSGVLLRDTGFYTLPSSTYVSSLSQALLQDGRIFLTGGHSQTGDTTNISPIKKTLYVIPDANQIVSTFDKNLIVNGDAESGSGVTDYDSTVTIPGWEVIGNLTAANYGVLDFPAIDAPGPETRGSNFFAGGPGTSNTSAIQTINFTKDLELIDSGDVKFELKGFLGGWAYQDDNAVITVNWKDESNTILGTNSIGPVYSSNRNGETGLFSTELTDGNVPPGTRKAEVQMMMTFTAGNYNDGYADNLSLLLSVPPTIIYNKIIASAGQNGTISPNGDMDVPYNSNQTFYITPSNGYAISNINVDGNSVGVVSEYTFTGVKENHTIVASFTKNSYTVTTSANTGGTITPNGPQVVNYGDNLTFNISSNNGYYISDVLVDGNSVGVVTSYAFTNISANHTLSVFFNPKAYVNTETINGSTFDKNSNSPIENVFVTAAGVVSGYSDKYGNFTLNNVPAGQVVISAVKDGYKKEIIVLDLIDGETKTASFKLEKKYTITSSANAGGTISPLGAQTVEDGDNIIFTITPNSGYHIFNVIVDNASAGVVSEYEFNDIAGNHTIDAVFVKNTYTVISSANAGGTISPLGSQTVDEGNNISFTITPNSGYEIADVVIDTFSVGVISSHEFVDVKSNHIIDAFFKLIPVQNLISQITVDKQSLDFGNANVNSSVSNTIIISNNGNADLLISDIALSGQNASDYNCQFSAIPMNIAPGATSTITVNFSPKSQGSKSAVLTISSNDPNSSQKTISLSGTGVIPPTTGGGGGKKGPCIISAINSDVQNIGFLNKIKDRFILSNSIGKFFTEMYYNYSPKVNKFYNIKK